MFIDNPRDHSIQHLSEVNSYNSAAELETAHLKLYAEKEEVKTNLENKINQISVAKESLTLNISGEYGAPLQVAVVSAEGSFEVYSSKNLENKGTESLNYSMLFSRLKAINDTEYFIGRLNIDNLCGELYLPFKELTSIKKKILFILNGSKEMVDPVEIPVPPKNEKRAFKPTLCVLISDPKDLYVCGNTSAEIFYKLPDCIGFESDMLTDLFISNPRLIPWFPAVIMGDDYTAAVEFLRRVQPPLIVTNNTGIAYEAYKMGIKWIAGPFLNIVNSFSLMALKENFNCSGSFISNEISKIQIRGIEKPEDFKLYSSIFHPIVLMTSRQCLFHQVTGCEKNSIDDSCLQQCERSSSITNLKNGKLLISKTRGNYHNIHHEVHFFNPDIVEDLKGLFSSFLINLEDIQTQTEIAVDKAGLIHRFENLLNENPGSKQELCQVIFPTTNTQYFKGI